MNEITFLITVCYWNFREFYQSFVQQKRSNLFDSLISWRSNARMSVDNDVSRYSVSISMVCVWPGKDFIWKIADRLTCLRLHQRARNDCKNCADYPPAKFSRLNRLAQVRLEGTIILTRFRMKLRMPADLQFR